MNRRLNMVWVIRQTLGTIGAHPGWFLAMIAIATIPYRIIYPFFLGWSGAPMTGVDAVPINLLGMLTQLISNAAAFAAASALALANIQRRPVAARALLDDSLRALPTALFIVAVINLPALVGRLYWLLEFNPQAVSETGLVLLLARLVFCWTLLGGMLIWGPAPAAAIEERLALPAAFARAAAITRGGRWMIVLLYLLFGLAMLVPETIAYVGLRGWTGTAALVIGGLVKTLIISIVGVIAYLGITAIYLDRRRILEGGSAVLEAFD